MNRTKNRTISAIFITLLLLLSCTVWNARKWEELRERDFVFTQFKYSNLSAGKSRALYAMREFPLRPVLESLRKKYAITIDSTEFELFLSRGDPARIREEGILMTNSYVWDASEKKDRRAEIEIKVNYGDDMRVMNYSYQVVLKTGSSVRAIYFDNVPKYEDIAPGILAHIGSGVTMEGYEPAGYAAPTKGPDKAGPISGRRWETEGRIKDQLDEYMKALTPENRKKFTDDMKRHLDEAVK